MDFSVLYNLDSKGKVRTWQMVVEGAKYKTVSGLEGGKTTSSGWSTAEPKNVGRANATTAEAQAVLEVMAEYKKKLDRKYYAKKEDALSGATGGHKFFAPMLAEKYEGWGNLRMPNGPKWVFSQPKLDGIRAIIQRSGITSRQGKPFPAVEFLMEYFEPIFDREPGAIFDGELYNHELKDDFNSISSLVKKQTPTPEEQAEVRRLIQYHVYDTFTLGTFTHRTAWLDNIDFGTDKIVTVKTVRVAGFVALDEEYSQLLLDGYEGQIIRIPDSKYENKRSYSLLKRKEFLSQEYPIARVESGDGNWAGYAKKITCLLPDGREFGAGVKGNQEFTKNLLETLPHPTTATVRYQNLTPDGVPRFPVAVAFFHGERDT